MIKIDWFVILVNLNLVINNDAFPFRVNTEPNSERSLIDHFWVLEKSYNQKLVDVRQNFNNLNDFRN